MTPPVETKRRRRRLTMRFIPIGITTEADIQPIMNASDYSDDKYEGVQLRNTKQNKMVLIMHSKKPSPMGWKVVYGFSTVFFNSLSDAVEFCEEHGMKVMR